MKHTPTSPEVLAAEARFVQSKREVRESVSRVRVAARAAIAKPSTLAGIAAAAGAFGFWLAHRNYARAQVRAASRHSSRPARPPATALVGGLITQYAMKAAPFLLQQFQAALQERWARHRAQREARATAQAEAQASAQAAR